MSEPSNPRVAIPKRLRMEVFKRDRFTCQYCGATPPNVLLQIDHVVPVALGGTNDDLNLVTACEACNQGKGAIPLTSVPQTVAQRAKREREMEEQILEYYRTVSRRRESKKQLAMGIATRLNLWDENKTMDASWGDGIMRFIDKLSAQTITELVDNANAKLGHRPASDRFLFFAKSCWNVIRAKEAANAAGN